MAGGRGESVNMKDEKTFKDIIVLGSGFSGSGAVFDYLAGRRDIADPLRGTEMNILQMPHGIFSFESAVYDSFFPPVATEFLNRLEWVLTRAAYPRGVLTRGSYLEAFIPEYRSFVKTYIDSITQIKYPFNYYYFFLGWPRWKCLCRNVVEHLTGKVTVNAQRAPVSRGEFHRLTRSFLKTLVNNASDSVSGTEGVVLDQAGSYWCPERSLAFFDDPYVIKVARDPRDQFVELKRFKGMKDVETFVDWYNTMMGFDRGSVSSYPERVLLVNFEDFVLDHEEEKGRLCAFLGIDSDVESEYSTSASVSNVGIYKNILTDYEKNYIVDNIINLNI